MDKLFLYPIIPSIILGLINWLFWKKRGYTSKVRLIITILLSYVGFYILLKKIL